MKLKRDFFYRDCLEVAPDLVGKIVVRSFPDGTERRLRITETEAYRSASDTACHARRGRTAWTDPLWREGGTVFVYLCYGIHELMNLITGGIGEPQGVLIRACAGQPGPGRLTKYLGVDRRFNGAMIDDCPELWVEDDGFKVDIILDKRVGIDYAAPEDREKLWRFKAAP